MQLTAKERYTITKPVKADKIALTAIVVIALLTWFYLPVLLNSKQGTTFTVKYDNQIVNRYDLSKDNTIILTKDKYPKLYGDELIIKSSNGYVWIDKETSPLNECSNMGKINTTNRALVCLPNYVMVSIDGPLTGSDEETLA